MQKIKTPSISKVKCYETKGRNQPLIGLTNTYEKVFYCIHHVVIAGDNLLQ
jgi:hypothetical protein